jgi:hypothetical protein
MTDREEWTRISRISSSLRSIGAARDLFRRIPWKFFGMCGECEPLLLKTCRPKNHESRRRQISRFFRIARVVRLAIMPRIQRER